jgi:amino acid adenylation domain-containing protein
MEDGNTMVLTEATPAPTRTTSTLGADIEPLSYVQKQLWQSIRTGTSRPMAVTACLRLRGALDRVALRSALDRLAARHAILRATFVDAGGESGQIIGPAAAGFALIEQEIDGELQLTQVRREEALMHFDIGSDPPIRGRLLRLAPDEHVLLVTAHRIVCDIASMGVLLKEFSILYGEPMLGRSGTLTTPSPQYSDWAAAEKRRVADADVHEQLEFWVRHLAGVSSATLLSPSPPSQVVHASDRTSLALKLPTALRRRLQEVCRRRCVPTELALIGTWAALLSRWTGRQEVVVSWRLPRRGQHDAAHLVGPLENSVALRIEFREEMNAEELLDHVHSVADQACAHSDVPFGEVASAVGASSVDHSIGTLCAGLAGRFGPDPDIQMPGLRIVELSLAETDQPDLCLILGESTDASIGTLSYSSGRIDAPTVDRLAECWLNLLKGLLKHPRRPIARIGMLSPIERHRVLDLFNDTSTAIVRQELVHRLVEEQVLKTPDTVCVEHAGQTLTYAELNGRANQLARRLRDLHTGAGRLVAICMERGPDLVVALLATLKAGAAYVPLDPHYPSERLAYMLRDAAPAVLLTHQQLRPSLPAGSATTIAIDADWTQIASYPKENLAAADVPLQGDGWLYVIYTSGSTGKPKATIMSHRAMSNLLEWHRATLPVHEGLRVLQFAALSFDVCFQEVFTTLCAGGTLLLIDEWDRRDSRALLRFLCKHGVQRLFLPPLMLQNVAAAANSTEIVPFSLRDVITAGEQLRISSEVVRFFRKLPECRLHNHYGPTESHVVTAATFTGNPENWPALPPIGRPIANTRIYVLDAHGQPVPTGVEGEIYIGGANIACGYLNRAELTAQRFVNDPFKPDRLARVYRTGDLGRWRPDGMIEYLGRNDDQVKIRGHRIELAEIEAQLATHTEVREAAVVAREGPSGTRTLVAYVTLQDQARADVEGLRRYLTGLLPQHMVPSAFVILDRFPLTPSGKLDRRALPAPDLAAYATKPYDPPVGELEQLLARVWQAVLGIGCVGRQDNFFGLGGDSICMVRAMESLRSSGWTTDVRSFFGSKTLADLATALRPETQQLEPPPKEIQPGCAAITGRMLPLIDLTTAQIDRIAQTVPGGAANIEDIYPLAPLQEGLLFHHLISGHEGDPYVSLTLLSVASRARLAQLIESIQKVIDRHPALRSAVSWEQLPRPVQVVYRTAVLPVEDDGLDPTRDAQSQLEEWLTPARQQIDLRRAPLVRLRTAPDPHSDGWYALLQIHHIASDNISQEIARSEIIAHLAGAKQQLPPALPYRNHVAHTLSCAERQETEAFFRRKLYDIEQPTAPFNLLDVRNNGSSTAEITEALGRELAAAVRARARDQNVSAATLLHAAWALVVAHTSAREDIVLGTVLLGRLQGRAGSQRMLGMFINTLPLRLRLKGVSTIELVEQTHRELAELLNHEQASLAVAQRCSAVPAADPLFTSLFNYRHCDLDDETEWLQADGVRFITQRERTNYPITCSIDETATELVVTVQTDGRITPTRIAGYMSTALQSLLEALERTPQAVALGLPILPEHERREVIESFNPALRPYPRDALIHDLFEAIVEIRPQATAAACGQELMTYAQLNARANRLSRYLCAHGLQVGERVAIVMERSLQLLIAQLAVLKSGGVYVPMDSTLPAERLVFMIEDSGARRVLCDQFSTEAAARISTAEWIDCAAIADALTDLPHTNPCLPIPRPAPAYVMYTSGSTGAPKGVIVAHHSVINLVIDTRYIRIEPDDAFAHCSNPSFDASTFEIWGALLNGARVIVVPRAVVVDPQLLVPTLLRTQVTVMFLTIGLFTQYVDALSEVFPQLRYLLTGGDVVDPNILRRVLQRCPPRHLLNAYGPTEGTTFTTTYEAGALEDNVKSIPIGRPISNAQAYILNGQMQPVGVGVTGELFIGGDGVALGYLNRPDLTAERFIADPFSVDPHARLYKTGDLARWHTDGQIEFLGRNDQQVKLRGFRIELGEIETCLLRCQQVKEAVVIVRTDTQSNKRLIAYVVPQTPTAVSAMQLRSHLLNALPEYMVPSAIVLLDRLPLNPNGKIDRRALPVPQADAYQTRGYESPHGDTEETLADIWRQLLHAERVGRNDNFFELGGHSLLAMQVLVHIRAVLALDLAINVLFQRPILSDLAAYVDSLREERMRREVATGNDDIEALFEQVASMPESRVKELTRELQSGGRV